MIPSSFLLEVNLKDRLLFNEITQLNVYVSGRIITDFEQHIIDIFLALNSSQDDDELDENESLRVVNSIDIFSKQQFQSMIASHLDELWAIFETLRRDRDREVIVIRAWNLQVKNMKIKISNHNKEKYEINEILRVVKVEISVAQTQCNELSKTQRVREDKDKQRKKTIRLSELEKFSSFEKESRSESKKRSFKQFDFFVEKARSDSKTRSFRHSDFSIFFEHKDSNTSEYIRYDIWKNRCIDKLEINFDWYVDEFKEVFAVIDWTGKKSAKHIDTRREAKRNFFESFDQIFKFLNDIYIDVDHLRNVRRQYDDLKMKLIEFFNEFYFEFILLINQLLKKNEKNKIHDFEKKITTKLQHVDVALNDYETLDDYFRKLQIMNNKHRRIKNNDARINISFTRGRSSTSQLSSRARRNEQYIKDLKTRYTTLLEKKAYKIVIARSNLSKLKKRCRKCDEENHWWKKCIFDKSLDSWVDSLIKQKMFNLQIISLINDNSSSIDDDSISFDASITFDVESKN